MNNPNEPLPKLRMATYEPIGEMIHRVEREQRADHLQRESNLDNSLAPFRVGSVPYLNAAPLTRGIEEQITHAPPSQLALMLQREELDAALVSIVEVLTHDLYDVLDGISIASLGEVKSVLLAHRRPLNEIREVHCDKASLTSVSLLRVLLAELGLTPEFKPFDNYSQASACDAVLLIGDQAIEFSLSNTTHQIYDLGSAWFEMFKLPFVYAVWALRRMPDNKPLRIQLREAKAFGMDTLDSIIANRTEFDYNFRKDYFTWHIHYYLGADEKRGIAKFMELLKKHGLGPVYEPRYVF